MLVRPEPSVRIIVIQNRHLSLMRRFEGWVWYRLVVSSVITLTYAIPGYLLAEYSQTPTPVIRLCVGYLITLWVLSPILVAWRSRVTTGTTKGMGAYILALRECAATPKISGRKHAPSLPNPA